MNDKQLEAARSQLSNEIAAIGYGWINGKYRNPPKKYCLREKEFDCIDMINSLLCYSYSGYSDDATWILHDELNSYHSYLASYVDTLGEKRVIELIQGQIDDIERVGYSVYTDSEGCTYNTLIWKNAEVAK